MPLTGTRVFVAEDEPMLLWALEAVLGDLGCQLAGTATTVADALTFVAAETFDVAILDRHLADGIVDPVVRALLARGTPVVIASGAALQESQARYPGAIVLRKPFKEADLRRALQTAIA
jgi:CheY-like chemotaxis protein